jgi:hypothetical protein
MPIRRMLELRNIDRETIEILVEAFLGVVADLGLQNVPDRERAAIIMIQYGLGQADPNAEWLRDDVVALMRTEEATIEA